jgi:3-oxoacyl-(acyl-carrier-protein) synthase
LTLPYIGVTGTGVICALGHHVDETIIALAQGRSGLRPLTRFVPPHSPLPVGEIFLDADKETLPLTHQMARLAADQAMAASAHAPDAIVLGTTTGGMAVTEALLKADCSDPAAYGRHAIGSVAEDLARRYHCSGPVMTVSTACSSGAGAIALAMALLRSGRYQRVLTGGADSLCRLTYYGFKSLQLIDPQGARPLDQARRGMSVAEGAGMLLLEANPTAGAAIYMLGAGLSCDAHHPAQPHPEGKGALAAMRAALADAGLRSDQIDYVNLHGTGTIDNDRAEAQAIHALFESALPPLSSIKGAIGHSLAASGAIEAVISARAIEIGLVPANTGCQIPDPELDLSPVAQTMRKSIATVLSNSFGFGGNNATLVLGNAKGEAHPKPDRLPLAILGWAAVTGAGTTAATVDKLTLGLDCRGLLGADQLSQGLSPRMIRRLKRLSLMGICLATAVQKRAGDAAARSVFFGTGWGALSETHDFIKGLFDSEEKFPSPIDFIGSVHNAAAGQVALLTHATGANITVSGGDSSFEQALLSAQLLGDNDPLMVLGADEGHPKLSSLFDPSVTRHGPLSDGGGVLMLQRLFKPDAPLVELKYFETGFDTPLDPDRMITALGGPEQITQRYNLILAGIPAAQRPLGESQLACFISRSGFTGPVLDYRPLIGEFATASAVATVFAAARVHAGMRNDSGAHAVLVLGLGTCLTAVEVAPS